MKNKRRYPIGGNILYFITPIALILVVSVLTVVKTNDNIDKTNYITTSITTSIVSHSDIVINTGTTTPQITYSEITANTAKHIVKTNVNTTTHPTYTTTTIQSTHTTTTKYSEHDLYVMSHIINAEAGSQSDECQIAVGSVILNRVKNSEFPNTIEGVVFQRGQYSTTWNGTYYNEPSKRSIQNAKYVLENGSQLPSCVLYQSMYQQGQIYDIIDGEYFCFYE